MDKSKDDINLIQVRAIMESMAHKHNCCITEIEIKAVQTNLGKGNNGTVGAYVKQVKQEFINSKLYDRANISNQLKSALIDEINRFSDNARQNASEGIETLERDYEDLLRMNGESRETIDSLSAEISAQQEAAGKEFRRQSDELAKAEQSIDTYREAIDHHKKDLETCRKDLEQAHKQTAALNKDIGGLEADVKTISEERIELSNRLSKAVKDQDNAETISALHEQALDHQKQVNDLQAQHKTTLELQIAELKAKVDKLDTTNSQLQEKLNTAARDHINDLKKKPATTPKPKKDDKKTKQQSKNNTDTEDV